MVPLLFQCTVKALYDYRAQREDELCFPKQALIVSVEKQDGGWWVHLSVPCDLLFVCYFHLLQLLMNLCAVFRWRGDYGGKKQLWFPANYVEEVPSSPSREPDQVVSEGLAEQNDQLVFPILILLLLLSQSTENSPLGTFLKGFIDVPTCHVGESRKHMLTFYL